MLYTISIILIPVVLFAGLFGCFEIGRRFGTHRIKIDPDGAQQGTAVIDGAIFALLGLLLAFTYSGASSRFDERKHLILDEVNNIGTAYLRIDIVPEESRPALRESFRKYVDSRLQVYQKLPDMQAVREELARSTELQQIIWKQAVAASEGVKMVGGGPLFLSAINEMIDITTLRTWAGEIHPPWIVYFMLFFLTLVSSFVAGDATAGSKTRSMAHMLGFIVITSVTVYVILDMEFPRLGLLTVESFDRALIELRASMN